MAKVTGPLFSLTASGQIAKSLVYMKWKGILDVRKYVIPANPKSTLQIAQRAIFHAAIDLWHATLWNNADKTAWNLFATIQDGVMSGFNTMVKRYTDAVVAGNTFQAISAIVISDITTTGFKITAAGLTGDTYTCKYGTSKSAMFLTAEVGNTAGVLVASPAALTLGTDYYAQISNTTATKKGITGIIKQRTALV